jgi:hypothetical protein
MGEQKWVRSSVRKLAERLKERGFPIAHNTVWHLLKRMGYSLSACMRRPFKPHVHSGTDICSSPARAYEALPTSC